MLYNGGAVVRSLKDYVDEMDRDKDIMPKFDKDVFECLIDKVIIGKIEENGTINPYTIRFICKNGTEINCKDKFTAMSDKQATNNIATSDNQHM